MTKLKLYWYELQSLADLCPKGGILEADCFIDHEGYAIIDTPQEAHVRVFSK